MEGQINELVSFLRDPNPEVRRGALSHLLGYTAKTSQYQYIFKLNNKQPIRDLKLLCMDNPLIAHDAFSALINLSEDTEICKELDDNKFLKYLNPKVILADLVCMLLSNITKDEKIADKLLNATMPETANTTNTTLVSSTRAMDQLVDVFVKGVNKEYNKHAEYHFLSSVFANVTILQQGRDFFLTDAPQYNLPPLTSLIIFIEHSNVIRRGGVVSCIKNCCFNVSQHLDLLSESKINLLPYILLPLCGPDEFDPDDMEGMPEDIQFLPPDKKRETDPHLRQTLLETILLLTSTRQTRDILRAKKVYPVIRQMHLVEKDENVGHVAENIVNMLMRDEAEEEKSELSSQKEIGGGVDDKDVNKGKEDIRVYRRKKLEQHFYFSHQNPFSDVQQASSAKTWETCFRPVAKLHRFWIRSPKKQSLSLKTGLGSE
ncbi:1189_t:CDS:10 [Ambispora gerdemannii]|uniref:Protein HGH1 homolog n=1 Tax=Ambispora gerdemannii TaxID=144530 RepID=A0A9N8UYZ5_9GLOM|nr:1189_t:CDS:10 [Ambispora gerdemannii]